MSFAQTLRLLHTDFVDEEHTGNQLGNVLINVSVDDLVDFLPQFVGDFCLFRFRQLAHHAHNILSTLWSCVGNVEIVKCDILYDLLFLVHISFRYGYVLLSLEIEFRGVCI